MALKRAFANRTLKIIIIIPPRCSLHWCGVHVTLRSHWGRPCGAAANQTPATQRHVTCRPMEPPMRWLNEGHEAWQCTIRACSVMKPSLALICCAPPASVKSAKVSKAAIDLHFCDYIMRVKIRKSTIKDFRNKLMSNVQRLVACLLMLILEINRWQLAKSNPMGLVWKTWFVTRIKRNVTFINK